MGVESTGTSLPALVLELREALGELSQAYRRLNYVMDPDMVEYCVYQINAASARCDCLYRTVKELEQREQAEARAFPMPEPERPPVLRAAFGRVNRDKEDKKWI